MLRNLKMCMLAGAASVSFACCAGAAIQITGEMQQLWNGETNYFPFRVALDGSRYQMEIRYPGTNDTLKITGFDGRDVYQVDRIRQDGLEHEFGHVDQGSIPSHQDGVGNLLWLAFVAKSQMNSSVDDIRGGIESLGFFAQNQSDPSSSFSDIDPGNESEVGLRFVNVFSIERPKIPGLSPAKKLEQAVRIGSFETKETTEFDSKKFPNRFELVGLFPNYAEPEEKGEVMETLIGTVDSVERIPPFKVLPTITQTNVTVTDRRFDGARAKGITYPITDKKWKSRDDKFLNVIAKTTAAQRVPSS